MNDAPRDNLIRARYTREAATLRDDVDPATARTLFGHFAVFDTWTKIDSYYEGTFLERLAPGAFADAIANPDHAIRVLYDHGQDPTIGNKPLAAPTVMREDDEGVYYEAELFDAGYVNDLLPAIRAGQLGASFRFAVRAEEWNDPPRPTAHNPERLAERTITDVNLYEFGPVTFPAYADASAGLRSATDAFYRHFTDHPEFVSDFTERTSAKVVREILARVRAVDDPHPASTEATDGPPASTSKYQPVQRPPLTRERRRKELAQVSALANAASTKELTPWN